MAQRRKSIRRKSLRRNNRTTLKRGGMDKSRKSTPPGFSRFIQTTMSKTQQEATQKEIDAKLAKYLKNNGMQNSNSYPSVERAIRKI